MGEIYNEVVELLIRNNLNARVEISFVDVLFDDLKGYDAIRKMVEKGFKLPILSIDGKIRAYSGPTTEVIFNDIKKSL